jgi:hypothetical protein
MIPDPHAYEYAEIINEDGERVDLPWREKSFWINDNKTLVLMIHPGRVKKAIRTTYELEPIFVEGHSFTLRIKTGLRSADKKELVTPFEYSYEIIGADKTQPELEYCDYKSLEAGTKSPLQIRFNETMDFGLIYKWVDITLGGNKVEGSFYSPDGSNWLFTPAENWQEGDYKVSVANKAGDLCHNQQDRLFEISEETDFSHVDYTYFTFSLSIK